jgi:hypothetical protein
MMWHRISTGWCGDLLKYVCVTMLCILPAAGIAMAGEKTSRWVDKPIVIDGNNKEWPQPYPFTEDENTKIQYAIANDAQTLYLTVKTSDAATKLKLRTNGFIILIDTTGKKLNSTLFDFTVVSKADVVQPDTSQLLNITDVRLKGTAGYDSTYKITNKKPGVTAAGILNDYNEIVVEIAIPFKCIYPNVADHVSSESKLDVCFTFFGLTNENIEVLERAANNAVDNAMPMPDLSKSDKKDAHGSDANGGVAPTRGANGGMGVGIGGSKGKGHSGGAEEHVIDANSIMQERQRDMQDNQVWKLIKLSYKTPNP